MGCPFKGECVCGTCSEGDALGYDGFRPLALNRPTTSPLVRLGSGPSGVKQALKAPTIIAEGNALGYQRKEIRPERATQPSRFTYEVSPHIFVAVSKGTLAPISFQRVQMLFGIVRPRLHGCSIASQARRSLSRTSSTKLISCGL
jgi:hypothetical protein